MNKTFAETNNANPLNAKIIQVEKIKYIFTNLNASNLEILDHFYATEAQFIDPLGDHQGLASIRSYYQHLYEGITRIDFSFDDIISDGPKHLLVWTMKLTTPKLNKGKEVETHGTSVIIFNEANFVIYHRDYFDMNEFIYRHIPVVGWFTRQVNQKLSP